MSSQWQQFVQLYREKNPRASMNQVKQSFDKLKRVYSQKGGFNNIDLANANLRYAAGVTPLNSGIAELSTLHKGGFNNIDLADPQLRYAAGVTPLNSGIAELPRGGQSGGEFLNSFMSSERQLYNKVSNGQNIEIKYQQATKTLNGIKPIFNKVDTIEGKVSGVSENDGIKRFNVGDINVTITKRNGSPDNMYIHGEIVLLVKYSIQSGGRKKKDW
jgi:hypothetical protein